MSLKNVAMNLCLAFVSLLFSFLLAELIFRHYWQPARLYLKKASALYRYDELMGWCLVANKKVERKTSEYRVIELTNSHGLRCPEVPFKKQTDEFRILFLGDSFAQGYTVEWEKTYAFVVKELVAKELNRKVTVVNGGCAGWSTDQQLLWYRRYGKSWKSDLIILLFYDNDLWYNTQHRYWRGFKPKFQMRQGEPKLVYHPERPIEWHHSSWLSHSYIALCLHEQLNGYIGFSLPRISVAPDFSEEFNRYVSSHKVTKEGWEITRALLSTLALEAKSDGSRFIVFNVPNRWSVDGLLKNRLINRYGKKAKGWDVKSISRRLPEVCKEMGIECIEPTKLFEQSREKLYFPIDGHWNEAGHHLAGTIIAGHVNNQY